MAERSGLIAKEVLDGLTAALDRSCVPSAVGMLPPTAHVPAQVVVVLTFGSAAALADRLGGA